MPFILSTQQALTNTQPLDLAPYKHLRPFIFGSKAFLHRYKVPAEKPTINVGPYNSGVNTTYTYPGRLSGSTIDLNYVKVWLDNALLNYFNDPANVHGGVAVANYNNRVRDSAYIFQTANGFNRSSVLGDRDVQVGDIVHVKATVSGNPVELWSSVDGLVADMSASSVSAATSDSNNKGSQSASTSINQVNGTPVNGVCAVANGAAYNSLADGFITRTYTVTVIQGSTGGNATTALLKVTSADGLDNQASITPSAFGSPTNIGTKGLTVTWQNVGCGTSASSSLISNNDFLVGQQWTVVVSQLFTAPVPTSGGVYNGTTDTTYIVKVTLGGKYTDPTQPQITVTTTTGVDVSGPTTVTATNTFVAIGTQGTLIKFSQSALCDNDIYYVPVIASKPAQVRTIVLKQNLPTALLTVSAMDLSLYILEPSILVPKTQTLPSPVTNWTNDQNGVTVNSGITQTAPGLTNGGVATYVPVVSGGGFTNVYLEYREWDGGLSGKIYNFNLRSQIVPILGIVDPDNPLAFAVDLALQNTATAVLAPNVVSSQAAANTDIVTASVLGGDPTVPSNWSNVLELITGVDNIYNLVPLTIDPTVVGLVVAHVNSQSTPLVPNYRACFIQGTIVQPQLIVNNTKTSDLNTALATLTQNPAVLTTSYTYLNVPANNANFITNGVLPGDTVRYQYSLDAFGNTTYNSYTVAALLSENTLILASGSAAPVNTAQRVEVWRNQTADQLATQIIAEAQAQSNTQVCLMWPDSGVVNGVTVAGYNICAAVAGLIGSVASHQGVRNVELLGFDSFPRARGFLSTANLDNLGANGVFVVDTTIDGINYIRWAVNTKTGSTKTIEEMYRRNTDFFKLALLHDIWGDLIGSANITDELISLMEVRESAFVSQLLKDNGTATLGTPVISADITSIAQDPVLLDRIDVTITFVGPFPDNLNVLTLIV